MTRYCPDLVSTSDWLLIKYGICEETEKQQQKGKNRTSISLKLPEILLILLIL